MTFSMTARTYSKISTFLIQLQEKHRFNTRTNYGVGGLVDVVFLDAPLEVSKEFEAHLRENTSQKSTP